jgi:hypothetical protein
MLGERCLRAQVSTVLPRELFGRGPTDLLSGQNDSVPMPIPPVRNPPLHRVAAHHARLAALAAIRDVVAVVVRQRSIAALSVVDDAITVAVCVPFDDESNGKLACQIIPKVGTVDADGIFVAVHSVVIWLAGLPSRVIERLIGHPPPSAGRLARVGLLVAADEEWVRGNLRGKRGPDEVLLVSRAESHEVCTPGHSPVLSAGP